MLNWALLKNPLNWAIVYAILLFSGWCLYVLDRRASGAQ